MPLDFTGNQSKDLSCVILEARDANTGKSVVVRASHEAIQDYSLHRVQRIAELKYDLGYLENDGTISVKTTDILKVSIVKIFGKDVFEKAKEIFLIEGGDKQAWGELDKDGVLSFNFIEREGQSIKNIAMIGDGERAQYLKRADEILAKERSK